MSTEHCDIDLWFEGKLDWLCAACVQAEMEAMSGCQKNLQLFFGGLLDHGFSVQAVNSNVSMIVGNMVVSSSSPTKMETCLQNPTSLGRLQIAFITGTDARAQTTAEHARIRESSEL